MADKPNQEVVARMLRRNREIGFELSRARVFMDYDKSQCAARIGKYRQYITRLETGATLIPAVELEELVRYLEIPPYLVYPIERGSGKLVQQGERPQPRGLGPLHIYPESGQTVYIHPAAGETVQIIVDPVTGPPAEDSNNV